MKVKELIAKLEQMPQDIEVLLQTDAEGNGYEELRFIDEDVIMTQSGYNIEIMSINWTAEEAGFDSEEEWKEYQSQHPQCCVLSP